MNRRITMLSNDLIVEKGKMSNAREMGTSSPENLSQLLHECLPHVDKAIRDYIEAILGDIKSWEELQETIGSLVEATGVTSEESKKVFELLGNHLRLHKDLETLSERPQCAIFMCS